MTASERIRAAREARSTNPVETREALAQAREDWLSRKLYLGNDGHYRLRSNSGRIAPYSRTIKRLFPDNFDFHAFTKEP